jgi:hypothetical protein
MAQYLIIEIRKDGLDVHTRLPILEDGQKKYESAKKDERNNGVYFCVILKGPRHQRGRWLTIHR